MKVQGPHLKNQLITRKEGYIARQVTNKEGYISRQVTNIGIVYPSRVGA